MFRHHYFILQPLCLFSSVGRKYTCWNCYSFFLAFYFWNAQHNRDTDTELNRHWHIIKFLAIKKLAFICGIKNAKKSSNKKKKTHRKRDQVCGYQRQEVRGEGIGEKVVKRYKVPIIIAVLEVQHDNYS